jgi:hypothetical protein
MTTNFFHSSLLLLLLDPGSGMGKNRDPGQTPGSAALLLKEPQESIPPAYVACAGNLSPAVVARNQVGIGLSYRPASLCSLATRFQTRFLESIPRPIAGLKIPTLVGRYYNPIPTRFPTPIDCSKIPALCIRLKYFAILKNNCSSCT